MDPETLRALRSFAEQIAQEAGALTLHYFRRGVEVTTKADRTPVTVADREAELLLRRHIEARYPDHGIVGEEFGTVRPDADFVWVLDPIDGTKSFVSGIPLFATLVGVLAHGQSIAGVICAPAMGELASAAQGDGCTLNGIPTHVAEPHAGSPPLALTSCTGDLYRHQPAFCCAYLERFPFHRTWADAYGYLMIAAGRAQVMVDAVMEVWDAAALYPIITEAQGIFTDWDGQPSVHGRCAVAGTPLAHAQTMALIREYRRR